MAYPASLDNVVAPIDGVTPINDASVASVFNAVNAIEAALGLNPQGTLSDLTTRVNTILGQAGGLNATGGSLNGVTIGAVTPGIGNFTSLTSTSGSINSIIGANSPQPATFTTADATELDISGGVVSIFSGLVPVNQISGQGGISINGRPRIGDFGNGLVLGEPGTASSPVIQILPSPANLIQTAVTAASNPETTPPTVNNILDDGSGNVAIKGVLYLGTIGNQKNLFSASQPSGILTTNLSGSTYIWPSGGLSNTQSVPIGGVVLVGNPTNNQLLWATLPSFIQTVLWQKYVIQITGANGSQPGSGYVTIYYPNGTNNKANPIPLTGTGSQQIILFSYTAGMIIEGVKIAVLSTVEPVTGIPDTAVSGANVSGGPGTITSSVGPQGGTVDKYASAYAVSTAPASGNFQVSQDFFGEDPSLVASISFNLASSNSSYPLSNLNGGQFHIWVKTETTI